MSLLLRTPYITFLSSAVGIVGGSEVLPNDSVSENSTLKFDDKGIAKLEVPLGSLDLNKAAGALGGLGASVGGSSGGVLGTAAGVGISALHQAIHPSPEGTKFSALLQTSDGSSPSKELGSYIWNMVKNVDLEILSLASPMENGDNEGLFLAFYNKFINIIGYHPEVGVFTTEDLLHRYSLVHHGLLILTVVLFIMVVYTMFVVLINYNLDYVTNKLKVKGWYDNLIVRLFFWPLGLRNKLNIVAVPLFFLYILYEIIIALMFLINHPVA